MKKLVFRLASANLHCS